MKMAYIEGNMLIITTVFFFFGVFYKCRVDVTVLQKKKNIKIKQFYLCIINNTIIKDTIHIYVCVCV